ncbi:MAG: DUF4255 domain-containing protein [Pseudoxanthomonas sp.]
MSAEAISRVTMALKSRLQAALSAAGDPGSVFVGPLDDVDASGASLILFLYRIVPNASLRNRERNVPGFNPPSNVITYRDSLPLDLYFLVTVGTRPGATGEEPLLRVLGFAMRELQNDPDLVGAPVANETIHVSLEPLSTDEVSRVWNLFPAANYRTSVAYLATPVWIDPAAPPPTAAPVTRDDLLASQHA